MRRQTENYFHSLAEPQRSCLLYLREFILNHTPGISESWSSHTPFYHFKNKSLGFISYHPKSHEIYISFTNGARIVHQKLLAEGRKKMKIFRVNPEEDIDIKSLDEILTRAISI